MARSQRDDTKGARTVIGEANPPSTNPRSSHDGEGATDRQQRIAQAAYHRWQERGGDHGRDQQDWFDAESDIDREERRPHP